VLLADLEADICLRSFAGCFPVFQGLVVSVMQILKLDASMHTCKAVESTQSTVPACKAPIAGIVVAFVWFRAALLQSA
jgi:hypothetical protein